MNAEPASGQPDYRFQRFTSADGLSENVVYDILQDSYGYLWIATDNGLNRYDGYTFRKFLHDPGDSTSISSGKVFSFCEDAQRNLWVIDQIGLCRYNREKGNFTRFNFRTENLGEKQIIPVDKENLLIHNYVNLYLFNILTHSFREVPLVITSKNFVSKTFSPLTINKSGRILVCASDNKGNGVLLEYDRKRETLVQSGFLKCSGIYKGITSFYFDVRGYLWYGTNNGGLFRSNSKYFSGNQEIQFHLVRDFREIVMNISQDRDSHLWVSSHHGAARFDENGQHPVFFTNSDSPFSLVSSQVNKVYRDKTGIVWFCTYGGLGRMDPFANKFKHYGAGGQGKTRLFNKFVLGIHPLDSAHVTVRYHFSVPYLSEWNTDTDSIRHFSYAGLTPEKFVKFRLPDAASRSPRMIQWLLETYKEPRKFFQEFDPRSLLSDKKVGSWLHRDMELIHFETGESWAFPDYISDKILYRDELWLATYNGLVRLDIRGKKITRFTANAWNSYSLNSNELTCLIADPDGNIWMGTRGGGVNCFERKSERFFHITEAEGLSNNTVYSLVSDKKGRIWAGTANGLSAIDPVTRQIRTYFSSTGLLNTEFNRHSACLLPDGSVLMGGVNGIDKFHPDSLIGYGAPPEIQITGFRVLNREYDPFKNIALSYYNNSVTINYSVMDFRDPGSNKYAYKMEGLDKDWIQAGGEHVVHYPYLSPGHYRFRVKGANSFGEWSADFKEVEFTIRLPWWKSPFLYGGIFLMIAGIFFLFYRLRIRHFKRMMDIRERISEDLHDEVGATLSSIHIYSSVAEKTFRSDPLKAVDALHHINKNTRAVMENMNDIIWAVNSPHFAPVSLLSKVKNFGYDLFTPVNINCRYEILPEAESRLVNTEARKNILMIIKEAMNNTAKYSGATEAIIRVSLSDGQFVVNIADNGKGMDQDSFQTGNGLKNMRKRAESLGGSFQIRSGTGKGTSVTASFPIPNIS